MLFEKKVCTFFAILSNFRISIFGPFSKIYAIFGYFDLYLAFFLQVAIPNYLALVI